MSFLKVHPSIRDTRLALAGLFGVELSDGIEYGAGIGGSTYGLIAAVTIAIASGISGDIARSLLVCRRIERSDILSCIRALSGGRFSCARCGRRCGFARAQRAVVGDLFPTVAQRSHREAYGSYLLSSPILCLLSPQQQLSPFPG